MINNSVGCLRSGAPTLSSFKSFAPRASGPGAPLDEVPATAVRPSKMKKESRSSPRQRDGRRLPLPGMDPDGYYVSLPRASAVRPDLHWFAVLHPDMRIHTDKTGHSYFNLKFYASRKCTFLYHNGLILKLVKRTLAVANYILWLSFSKKAPHWGWGALGLF